MNSSADTDRHVARLARVHDDALSGFECRDAAQSLLAAIVAKQPPPPGKPAKRHAARVHARRMAMAAAAAGAMTAAVVAGPSMLSNGTDAATSYANSAIEVHQEGDVFVARIKDPLADYSLYEEAFRAVGKNVEITLVPVPPAMVGMLLRAEGEGTTSATSMLDCSSKPKPCSLVIKVSVQGSGTLRQTIGRAARPGETYQTPSDASSAPATSAKPDNGATTGGSGG